MASRLLVLAAVLVLVIICVAAMQGQAPYNLYGNLTTIQYIPPNEGSPAFTYGFNMPMPPTGGVAVLQEFQAANATPQTAALIAALKTTPATLRWSGPWAMTDVLPPAGSLPPTAVTLRGQGIMRVYE